jgi:RNA polymerase sigma-70 factor, ECF subfamily
MIHAAQSMTDERPIAHDHSDFESLTLPHLQSVARFALSLTRNHANADDLVQETYLRALRGWKTFRPGSDPRRWLFAICRNTFLRYRRDKDELVESDDGDLDAMPAVLGHVRAVHEGLGEVFDLIDVQPAIVKAIDELPEPHHTILVLVDLEGCSYEEAASILDVPVGTVRSRLYRARRMIQEALLAYAHDAGIGRRQSSPVDSNAVRC